MKDVVSGFDAYEIQRRYETRTKFMERSRKGQAAKVMVRILCVCMFMQSMIIYPN
jgi:hypothetical protein